MDTESSFHQNQLSGVSNGVSPASPKYFDIVAMLFIAVYLISQVSSSKLFSLGYFQFPGAIIIFPISYIFGDILTEVYGYSRTRRVIWVGFASVIILSVVLWIVQVLPPAQGWGQQQAYVAILGVVPRIVLGSISGYWAGEFTNSFVLAKMKIWTKGRHLWSRTIGSTVVGQVVDTVLFVLIAYVGIIPFSVLFKIVISVYLFKVAYEIVATPVTYVVVGFLKRVEGIDVYDYNTEFTPFKF